MKRMLAFLMMMCLFAGCTDENNLVGVDPVDPVNAEAIAPGKTSMPARTLTVMSRNMYIGTDVERILAAQTPEEIPGLVAQVWATMMHTNYPERARALAREIARAGPHLVGLQEVTLIRTQFPGDAVLGGTTPAEDVVFDFLPTLLEELEALGQTYRVVAEVQNMDAELPRRNLDNTFTDVRMTDFDAILARDDVRIDNVVARNYAAYLPVFGFQLLRGWVAVDATVRGATYRFVSTHLEPDETAGVEYQMLQTAELIAALASERRPLIVVGDLNTMAPAGESYRLFLDAGYEDAWAYRARLSDPGFTCCHLTDLSNAEPTLDRRIDLVLMRNVEELQPPHALQSVQGRRIDPRQAGWWRLGPPVKTWIVGAHTRDRTPSGLWPSDHAGVVVRLLFPPPGR